MTRPLIYFNGSHVMLIRESDIPQEFKGCWCKNQNKLVQNCHYEIGCFASFEKYKAEIEAAKKKAIKVENVEYEHGRIHIRKSPAFFDYLMHYNPNTDKGGKDLPECYTYEVLQYTNGESGNESLSAIIKPLQPVESEDDDTQLWKIIDDGRKMKNLTITIVEAIKSKYTLTRKP